MAKKIYRTSPSFGSDLEDFFLSPQSVFSLTRRIWNPPTNVFETKDKVIIKMEVAGIATENVNVTSEGRRLIVRGQRTEPGEVAEDVLAFHLVEVQYGPFERVFEFPFSLNKEDVQARYENGFLWIQVPKRSKQESTVRVTIVTRDTRES